MNKIDIENDQKLIGILTTEGYTRLRFVDGWGWCGIRRMLFTVGVFYGLNDFGPAGRFCFDTLGSAEGFLANWDGKDLPKAGVDGCTALK